MFLSRLIKKIFGNKQRNPSVSPFAKGRGWQQEVPEQTELESINARLTKLESDLEKAVTGYRQMLINNNPEILPEMIGGSNIDELDGSVKTARELTEKIKAKLEQKITAEKVPGGAPVRTLPDIGNLSSYEKIIYGLEQK